MYLTQTKTQTQARTQTQTQTQTQTPTRTGNSKKTKNVFFHKLQKSTGNSMNITKNPPAAADRRFFLDFPKWGGGNTSQHKNETKK